MAGREKEGLRGVFVGETEDLDRGDIEVGKEVDALGATSRGRDGGIGRGRAVDTLWGSARSLPLLWIGDN